MSPTVEELLERRAIQIETRLRLLIRPKPFWLPHFVWKWLLNSLMDLEVADKFK